MVRNEFDIQLYCQLDTHRQDKFVIRNRIKLPLGWEAIEVYPPFDEGLWDPAVAAYWAETDLLAAVLQRSLTDQRFRALDPRAEARKQAALQLREFEALLVEAEEPLHQFFKNNPRLLHPTHTFMRSKLRLGDRVTDFVFRDPTGEYLLVELESPSQRLFREDGQERQELTHALSQVTDWRRYLENNLSTVQHELGLEGISVCPKALVVIGRSSSLSPENRRKLTTMANERPTLRIITYDDLLSEAKAAFENLLGPIWDAGPSAEVYLLPSVAN